MPSPKQINSKIEHIAEKYKTLLKYMTLGPSALTKKELKLLIRERLLSPKFFKLTLGDAYMKTHGHLLTGTSRKSIRELTVKHLKEGAGRLIDSFVDKIKNEIGGIVNNNLLLYHEKLKNVVPETLAAETLKGTSVKTIARVLRDKMENYATDWNRIVTTEISRAHNLASVDSAIENNKDKKFKEIYVYYSGPTDTTTCLTKDSQIYTTKGLVDLDKVTKAHRLPAWNNYLLKHGGHKYISQVEGALTHVQDCIRVTFDNGKVIECTPDHPVLIKYKTIYLFWEIGRLPVDIKDCDIVDAKKLTCQQKHHIFRCLHNALCQSAGCTDFWEFTQKYKNIIIQNYKNQITVLNIAKSFNVSHHCKKYISAILRLSGINTGSKARIRNENFNNEQYLLSLQKTREMVLHQHKDFILNAYTVNEWNIKQIVKSMNNKLIGYKSIRQFLINNNIDVTACMLSKKAKGGIAMQRNMTPEERQKRNEVSRNIMLNLTSIGYSKPQMQLFNLLKQNGYDIKFNPRISNMKVDMLINDKIVIEFDGSGHNLQVRLRKSTQKALNKRDYARDVICRKLGYKVLRIRSPKDKLPSMETLTIYIDELSKGKNFLRIET